MEVFEIVSIDKEQIVLKVNAEDNLTVALHPYISREYDYITVTRGDDHILTVIKKDGSTFSFHWGTSGYTLVDENLTRLKREVVKFIDSQYILLEMKGEPIKKVTIFYNKNYKKWQATFNSSGYFWDEDATNENEMMIKANEIYAKNGGTKPLVWGHAIAVTGIDVWEAWA